MVRWMTTLVLSITWMGLLQVGGLAAIPEDLLDEALSSFRRGQYELFKRRLWDALQHEWTPSIYGPRFTLVKVPERELGNVGFASIRETARSLREYLQRENVGPGEARLAIDYLLKLTRSRSPQPEAYFSVFRACWMTLREPLARYVNQHGSSELRKRFAQLEQLHQDDSKYLASLLGGLRGEEIDEATSRRITTYAGKRLPLWEKRLSEARQLLEASQR